jgi:uncharacterized RDD family membrane protein YckC
MNQNTTEYLFASKGKRVVNFLIDGFVISIVAISIANKMGVQINLNPKTMQEAMSLPSAFYNINLMVQIAYYFILEYTTNTTLGKLITRTKVIFVNEHSNKLIACIIRSTARAIPFSPIIALFLEKFTLHDIISRTIVIQQDAIS